MDSFQSLFVCRGNNNTSAIRCFLERIVNLFPQLFHFRYSRWNGIVDKHRDVEVTTLKCFCDVSQVHPDVVPALSIGSVFSINLNHTAIRVQ